MKKRKFIVSLAALLLVVSMVTVSASAHEMFFTAREVSPDVYDLTLIPINWVVKNSSGTKLQLLSKSYLLNDTWHAVYSTSIMNWNSECGAFVNVRHEESVVTANVLITTPTATFWDTIINGDDEVLGRTVLYDTTGYGIDTPAEAGLSNKRISSANIYMNPNTTVSGTSAAVREAAMTHEIGHVLCLGHSDIDEYNGLIARVWAVMKQDVYYMANSYTKPQEHEREDLENKYINGEVLEDEE